MKSKVLTVIVASGIIYLLYFLYGSLVKSTPKPFIFRQKYLAYGAEWFQSKNVQQIISTRQIGKHRNVFNDYDIKVFVEKYVERTEPGADVDMREVGAPMLNGITDLKVYIEMSTKSKSKGLYVQGEFLINDKSIELLQRYIDNKGFVYFNSPSDFFNISEAWIAFLKKNVSAGSIAIMDFTDSVHTAGSSIMDNLQFIIQYDNTNTDRLMKKLKQDLETKKMYEKERDQSGYQE